MKVLIIEPFYGGSHKQLVDLLSHLDNDSCCMFTLPAKKWHWRARTSALYFAQVIPNCDEYSVLFCSSVLNLVELLALRPDLQSLKKVIYFHENQLVYPIQKQQHRDFQYGYNQILSSISSFFHTMPDFRPKGLAEKIQPKCEVLYFPIEFPDRSAYRTDGYDRNVELIDSAGDTKMKADLGYKCSNNRTEMSYTDCVVVETNCESQGVCSSCNTDRDNEPNTMLVSDTTKAVDRIDEGHITSSLSVDASGASESVYGQTASTDSGSHCSRDNRELLPEYSKALHIIWPHRWEHDKDPESFLRVIHQLHDAQVDFKLSIIGQTYADVSPEFTEARSRLNEHVLHWGYLESRDDYYKTLSAADVVVSTAKHEFFGVAMLEAVYCGCYPLCPGRLVYPEIFPSECLYKTEKQLLKRLKLLCRNPSLVRNNPVRMDLEKYSWKHLRPSYCRHLGLSTT